MSVYRTEEEQLEAIKKWWQRYSTVLSVVFSCVLLSVSAYKYWQWHQIKVSTEASNAYEHLMVSFSNQDSKGIRSYANQLISQYGKTVYAHAARLTLAKWYVARDHHDKALALLETVANSSPQKALKQVARIRIARLLAAEKSYDKALTELSSVEDQGYVPVINELKGDIYVATKQYQQAITAYREAITAVRTRGLGNLYLEMKTNEIAALSQSEHRAGSSAETV